VDGSADGRNGDQTFQPVVIDWTRMDDMVYSKTSDGLVQALTFSVHYKEKH